MSTVCGSYCKKHSPPSAYLYCVLLCTLCTSLLMTCPVTGAQAENRQSWTGSWYSSPMESAPLFAHATVRTVVHPTVGGDRVRLRFSNLYGRAPLKIGAVRVTVGAVSADVNFKGEKGVIIPAHGTAVSDSVDLKIAAGADLVVSAFYPDPIPREVSLQGGTAESSDLIAGDATQNTKLASDAKPLPSTYFLTAVEVQGTDTRGTIVVLGDSMTIVAFPGTANKWPALLAQRLANAGKHYGVLNAAIGGNRILRDSQIPYGGPAVLNRIDRDVFDQPDVKYVILSEGVNDIGVDGLDGSNPPHSASAEELIGGVRQVASKAHQHGIKLYAATLEPFGGIPAPYYTAEKNKVRLALNEWLRTSREIDGYFDFDHALADPARPENLRREFDLGNNHPNEEGQRALSESIDLSRFE